MAAEDTFVAVSAQLQNHLSELVQEIASGVIYDVNFAPDLVSQKYFDGKGSGFESVLSLLEDVDNSVSVVQRGLNRNIASLRGMSSASDPTLRTLESSC